MELAIRDVSEETELALQLAGAQKMETVAELARGLAHDFNNILSGILGATSLARRTTSKDPSTATTEKILRYISIIEDCGDNAARILNRLNSFRPSTVLPTQILELQSLISEVADICHNVFPVNISMAIDMPEEPFNVKADATSLSQAILNLCINARDAIGEKPGHVQLRIHRASPHEIAGLADAVAPDEEYCCVEVEDDGVGINDAIRTRIFDPFFTTKEDGTGIGLAMVSVVAAAHGGTIRVESTPGRGSRFMLYVQISRDSLLPMEAT
jgi:two-component system cell cycle sensor histidine kinase/response regulator CckA